ncbi:hypothetical protein [Priestia endophytica]|uniref:hypothetical protein n=1 Tax=Priestia endophytica TaxID=135735 RepID=UPI002282BE11|nr:hypothetical protein [Priestia endophytica]MCY8235448.1 hypothetical protein [Priestia endophytica]
MANLADAYNQLFQKGDKINVVFNGQDLGTGVFLRAKDNFLVYVDDGDNELRIVPLTAIVVNEV